MGIFYYLIQAALILLQIPLLVNKQFQPYWLNLITIGFIIGMVTGDIIGSMVKRRYRK